MSVNDAVVDEAVQKLIMSGGQRLFNYMNSVENLNKRIEQSFNDNFLRVHNRLTAIEERLEGIEKKLIVRRVDERII